MADIKIFDLQSPAGLDFFADDEGYLNELSEDELTVWGGGGDNGGNSISGVDISDSLVSVNSDVQVSIGKFK